MDSTSTFFILDLISLGCGIYCFYTWFRLLTEKKLFKNGLLVPKEKQPSDCSDEAAYIRYVKPRLAVLAITTSVYGILQILNSFVVTIPFMNGLWSFLPLCIVLGALIWYAVCNGKANREYFGM